MDLVKAGCGSVTRIISLSATALLLTYFWFSRRNPKYPPCPLRPWPIVGNLLQLNPDPREQFARFRKQCGDIFSIYMGSKHIVVLNGLDVVTEAFVKQGDAFSDRAITFIDIATGITHRGIVSSSGNIWKENRTISTAILRKLGSGKNILADKIQDEVNHFLDVLESLNGEPTDIHPLTSVSSCNIICSVIVGQRYEYDDTKFQRLQEIIQFNMSKASGTALLNYFSWLRFLPGDLFYCKVMARNFVEFYEIFCDSNIKANEEVVGEAGNFIAACLQAMKINERTREKTFLDNTNLKRLILDLIFGGTETVTISLDWFFLYMATFPDVQEKIFDEIKDVVGLDRTPVMQDKARLINLTATIMEIQRLITLLPLSVPRILQQDANLRGFLIPKGTEILVNYISISHDPTLWGDDAECFRPERFIAGNGNLNTPEAWIPFSIGRRVCVGEGIAKMELFLFTANILQRFKIVPVGLLPIPVPVGNFGIANSPQPYKIQVVTRKLPNE